MNEAMPRGRVFGTPPPAVPSTQPGVPPTQPGVPPTQPGVPPTPLRPPTLGRSAAMGQTVRATPAWLVPLVSALGGAAAGAALTAAAVVLLGATAIGGDQLAARLGEPLDGALTPLGEPAVLVPDEAELVVDVAGAVERPGLHRLRRGDRVGDAIEAAGGYGPRADLAAVSAVLNLAQPLEDGTKVLVPELGIDRIDAATASDGRIDLNRADQAELETLPGVGPVTAQKILASRAEGRFSSVRDLRTRGLVGESAFEDIAPLVRAG